MALKAILESLDGLDDTLKSEYVERDGKFFLDVEAVDGFELSNSGGLKSSLSKEIQKRKRFEEKLKAFDGIDPDKVAEALEELEQLRSLDPTKEADKLAQAKVDAATKQIVAKHEKELSARDMRINSLRTTVEDLLIDQTATAEISTAKGVVDLLLPHVKRNVRVVEEDEKFHVEVIDKDGNPRIGESDGSKMTIRQLIAEMRDSDVFGRAFEGDGTSGSGRRPGSEGRGNSPKLKRSEMTADQKREYQQKHGQAAFLKLPK